MAGMVATRRKPKPVTVSDPDEKMSARAAYQMAGVSVSTFRKRRPELIAAGAVQVNATRWEVTPRQMEAAGMIRIQTPKKTPEADPLEAAQAAREAARREQTADPYGARVRRSANESQAAAAYAAAMDGNPTPEGVRVTDVHWTEGIPGSSAAAGTIAELRHAAELERLRHAAELADARRETAEAKAIARAHADRAGAMEMLAKERGRTIAMLEAMLGGAAPVTRALDA